MADESWEIRITKAAAQDLQKVDQVRVRVRKKLEWLQEVGDHVQLSPLRGSLAGFLKLRVGDYRIVLHRDPERRLFIVIGIAHRRHVYQQVERRV